MRSAGVVRARHFVAAGGAGAELGSEQPRTLLHNGVPSPQQPKHPSTSHILLVSKRTIKTATATKQNVIRIPPVDSKAIAARSPQAQVQSNQINQITSITTKQSPSIEIWFSFEKPSLQTCLPLSCYFFFDLQFFQSCIASFKSFLPRAVV
jgi:hypothetical protein